MSDKENQSLGMLAPVGNIEGYVKAINQVPMLEIEDERALAIRLRDYGDLEAARKLVLSHLRLVVSIARGYVPVHHRDYQRRNMDVRTLDSSCYRIRFRCWPP